MESSNGSRERKAKKERWIQVEITAQSKYNQLIY